MRAFICYMLLVSLFVFSTLQAQQAAWELVREGLYGKIAIDPVNPEIIYVASNAALSKSLDGGRSWVTYREGYGIGDVKGIVIDPNNPQRLWIYGTPYRGVDRSENGGVIAERADNGISYDHHGYQVSSFAYDYVRDILYAGNEAIEFGIYRSYDGGRQWELVNHTIYPTVLMVVPDSGWVYCGGPRGLFRSKDLGNNWQQLHPEILEGRLIYFLAGVPNSQTLYAAGLLGEIYKSYNLGETWRFMPNPIPGDDVLSGGLIVSLKDTNYAYVGSSNTGLRGYGGFYMSRNGAQTWGKYNAGLPDTSVSQLAIFSLAQTQNSEYLYMSIGSQVNDLYKLSQSEFTSVLDHAVTPLQEFLLQQNYPNPFNNQTRISFSLKEARHISLVIYDLTGDKVASLAEGLSEAGLHTQIWNGKNSRGGEVSSGIYILRLQAVNESLTRKMLLIR